MKYHYITNGTQGEIEIEARSLAAHQQAFNAVAEKLTAAGWIRGDWRKSVRYEGNATIDGKRYPAILQGSILVVAGPMPPAAVRLDF